MRVEQHTMFPNVRRAQRRQANVEAPKGKRHCSKCGKFKLLSMFNRRANGENGGFSSWCKTCLKEKRQRYRDIAKAVSWRRHYGLTPEQYQELFDAQRGVCAICGQPETRVHKGTLAHLSVDHNHATGNVRGLLCFRCNHGIASFKDDVALLEQAVAYLQHYAIDPESEA